MLPSSAKLSGLVILAELFTSLLNLYVPQVFLKIIFYSLIIDLSHRAVVKE